MHIISLFVIGLVQIYSMRLLIVRNHYLRVYIYNKNAIKDKTTIIYNRILSKYYDAHATYYSLPQDDLDLIEQLLSLHF